MLFLFLAPLGELDSPPFVFIDVNRNCSVGFAVYIAASLVA